MSGEQAVPALQELLRALDAAIYGYGVAGAQLPAAHRAAAQDWTGLQETRDTLESLLTSRGAQPDAAAAAYRLPFPVHNGHAAVSLAGYLEEQLAGAYLGLVALPDPAAGLGGPAGSGLRGPVGKLAGPHFRLPRPQRPGYRSRAVPVRDAKLARGPVTVGRDVVLARGPVTVTARDAIPVRGRVTVPGSLTARAAGASVGVRRGQHVRDPGRSRGQVRGSRDPLRPGPPEPPAAVLAAARVHVLGQCRCRLIHDPQAGHPARRGHQVTGHAVPGQRGRKPVSWSVYA